MGAKEPNSTSFKKGHATWNKKYATKEEAMNVQRKNAINYNREARLIVLRRYSGSIPFCACCGEREIKFLAIDHINGGGTAHRRVLGKKGKRSGNIAGWIIRNNFPPGFQILCHNCNGAKGYYGACPHSFNSDV